MKERLKALFSRKFVALVLGLGVIWAGVFVGRLVDARVTLILCSSTLLLCFAYIGGNVWSDFIKSKYFHDNLIGK